MKTTSQKLQLIPEEIRNIILSGKYPFDTSKWDACETYSVICNEKQFGENNSTNSLLEARYIAIGDTSWGDEIAYDTKLKIIVQIDHELFPVNKVVNSWMSSKEYLSYLNLENKFVPKQSLSNKYFSKQMISVYKIMITIFVILALFVSLIVYWGIR